MSEPVLLVDKSEGIATLTLNRPKAMNALSRELRRAIVKGFEELDGDDGVGAVILTGAGRAFCAGLDLKELSGMSGDGAIGGTITGGDLVEAMEACKVPIIGAINGVAVTGGFEIALACDVLIASTEGRFADTHARVGIVPGWGLSQKLPRAIGVFRAKELSLTGNYLSAEKAEAWGLVNRVVAPDQLLPTCRALAQDMLSCDPTTMRGIKRLIDDGLSVTLAEGREIESRTSKAHAGKVTPEALAERREKVQARGRSQTS
jgi:enoyl-CoA hydratase